jgi:(S)-ureidoglycine aminohydrolase
MKSLLLVVVSFISYSLYSQVDEVKSAVYQWSDLEVEKEPGRERRQIIKGSTRDFAQFAIHATTLEPGKAPHAPHAHDDEELIIVKDGKLKVSINGQSKVLGAGSVAVAMPGEQHGFENAGQTQVTYYILRYQSRTSVNNDRGKQSGASFMLDWNDISFNPHDKGGIRRYFDKPTAMCERFEMHVTTLKEGLKSHDPHTHRAGEVILLLSGSAEMQIGDQHLALMPGGLAFLESEVSHALKNVGSEPCVYFAFQMQ